MTLRFNARVLFSVAAFLIGAACHFAVGLWLFDPWLALDGRAGGSEFLIAHGLGSWAGVWSMFYLYLPNYFIAAGVGLTCAVLLPRFARPMAAFWCLGLVGAAALSTTVFVGAENFLPQVPCQLGILPVVFLPIWWVGGGPNLNSTVPSRRGERTAASADRRLSAARETPQE
jgi:hypothetical protein